MTTSVEQLESAWLSSRSTKDGEALVAAICDSGSWAVLSEGVVFIQVSLPQPLQQALAIHQQVTEAIAGSWQKILTDLLLFRLVPPDPLQTANLSIDAFIFFDDDVVNHILSSDSDRSYRLHFLNNLLDHLDRFQEDLPQYSYYFSEVRTGDPLCPEIFGIDWVKANKYFQANSSSNSPEKIQQFREEITQRDLVLAEGIAAWKDANLFGANDRLFVHWVNDDQHHHGFIFYPWTISVGTNYALVEVRRGTWY